MNRVISKVTHLGRLLAIVAATLGVVGASGVAHADNSCTGLMGGMFSQLRQYGGQYTYELTVTTDAPGNITYDNGRLQLNGAYVYDDSPSPNYVFSDRVVYSNGRPQRFINTGSETIRVWIDEVGKLWILNVTYNYWIVSGEDMACSGHILYKYAGGKLYTIAIRDYQPPIS